MSDLSLRLWGTVGLCVGFGFCRYFYSYSRGGDFILCRLFFAPSHSRHSSVLSFRLLTLQNNPF